ncbi:uncharacterized protein [Argopecten irradians]|uniref:uncharacterized protein n=1 Tax=Argopecten irradians TaxID=31199 RepID=UPI00371E4957
MDVGFYRTCGDNVRTKDSERSATWSHTYSGGILFSKHCLRYGETVNIEITGNGHAAIGFTQNDPRHISCIKNAVLTNDIKLLTNVRTLQRAGTIKLRAYEDHVNITCNGCSVENDRDSTQPVWLVINLKFGNVQANMFTRENHPLQFHNVTGENIDLMDKESRSARLKVENPASVCCLARRIYPGQGLMLKVRPLQERGRIPSRFHLTLGMSTLKPEELRIGDPESFTVCEKVKKPKRWRHMKRFEDEIVDGKRRNRCTGYLQVMVTPDGEVKYAHSSDVYGHVTVPTSKLESGVLIVFELFRVTLDITKTFDLEVYDYADINFGQFDKRKPSLKPSAHVHRHDTGYVEFQPQFRELVTKVPSNAL